MTVAARPSPCWRAGRTLLPALLLVALPACTPFQPGAPGDPAGEPGRAVLQAAESRLGAPYRYGGAGPDAFDCSGPVAYAHQQVGIRVPR